jgi:hypothetical protein
MRFVLAIFIFSIILVSCKNEAGKSTDSSIKGAGSAKKITAVCISNGVPIREEPHKEGKWISSMNLGETSEYLGESVIDSADRVREYYRLELSDGSVQWVQSYGILLDAKPAAVVSETPIYVRPDLVTKTDKSFKTVEFLAIVNEKDDWIEVVGAEKRKSGWIKKEAVSMQKEDVAVATLANKALIDKNGDIMLDKLPAFLDNLPYQNTRLASYLQQLLEEHVENTIEESIQEYEQQPVENDPGE